MRADRLLQILLILQRSGKITSKQLAARLEVSERTVFRDMDALSAAGIPIVADRGTGGGWYLHEGYKSALTDIRREDIQSLLFPQLWAMPTYSARKDSFARASQKLLSALPPDWRKEAEHVRRRIHVDGAGWYSSGNTTTGSEDASSLHTLMDAIWARKKATFLYSRDEGHPNERTVSPLGLVLKGTIWYLVASIEDTFRTYRVSRISKVMLLEEQAAEAPQDFDLEEYWIASVTRFKEQLPVYPAVLHVEPDYLRQLSSTRFVQVEQSVATENGPLRVHVRFDTIESAVSILLSFGGTISVEGPPVLKQRVRDAAARILNAH